MKFLAQRRRPRRTGRTTLAVGITSEPYEHGLVRLRIEEHVRGRREAEITCTPAEVPLLVTWAVQHEGSTHTEPLPCEERRQSPWGPEYRWTDLAHEEYVAATTIPICEAGVCHAGCPHHAVSRDTAWAARRWLRRRCVPTRTLNTRIGSSYRLKHLAEAEIGRYVSNGAMLLALVCEGYRLVPIEGTPNAYAALRVMAVAGRKAA